MDGAILLSKKSVAALLSVSIRTVENLIARKELAVRHIGRRTLVSRKSLEHFARRDHRTQPPRAADEQLSEREAKPHSAAIRNSLNPQPRNWPDIAFRNQMILGGGARTTPYMQLLLEEP
jgi:excisionase family DNA binding protein